MSSAWNTGTLAIISFFPLNLSVAFASYIAEPGRKKHRSIKIPESARIRFFDMLNGTETLNPIVENLILSPSLIPSSMYILNELHFPDKSRGIHGLPNRS